MPKSLIYRSSAGSGKTYTLIFNYLKVLLGDPGRYNPHVYKQILAITFTNKAANEMKSRLVENLKDIALEKKEMSIFKALQKELKISEDVLSKRAKDALGRILQNYGHLNILTIDSFFQSIIRSFSKELNLPFNYSIEMQISYVQEALALGLYNTAIENKQLFNTLLEYALEQVKDGKSWNFEKAIVEFSKNVFNSEMDDFSYSEGQIKEIHQNLKKARNTYFEIVQNTASSILAKLPSNLSKEDFTRNGFYIDKISDFGDFNQDGALYKNIISNKSVDTLLKNLSGDVMPYNKTSTKKMEIEAFMEDTREEREQILDLISKEHLKVPVTAIVILKDFYQIGLFKFLKNELAKYRKENETLLISDLTTFINKMIEDEDIPFIYEKRGSQFQYLFFDEFQDTSLQQWQNVFPLIEHILSQARNKEPRVILVGDAKQSIYRWRKGEIDLILNSAPSSLADYGLEIRNLSENYRSFKNIIDFNNKLFRLINQNWSGEDANIQNLLSDVNQEFISTENGYIEVNLIKKEKKEEEEKEYEDEEKDSKWEDLVLERVYENIIELTGKYNYKKSDICLLIRTNKEGSTLANFLLERNITFSSPDSVLLKDSMIVKFILSTLKYIENNKDDIAYTEMAYYLYLMQKIEGKEVEDIFDSHNNSSKLLHKLYPEFFEKVSSLKSTEVSSLLFQITALFDVQDRGDVFWMQLLTSVQSLEIQRPSNIISFFEWWEKDGINVKVVSGSEDAVQVMTIHKSKGLEFPVVIIPFCSWDYTPKTNSTLWMEIEEDNLLGLNGKFPISYTQALGSSYFGNAFEEENRMSFIDSINMLYVAVTRAEQQLYLYMPEKDTAKGIDKLLKPLLNQEVGYFQNEESPDKYTVGNKFLSITKAVSKDQEVENKRINHTIDLNGMIAKQKEILKVKRPSDKFYNNAQEKGVIIHEVLQKVDFKESNWKTKVQNNYKYKHWFSTIESVLESYYTNNIVQSWNVPSAIHYTERDVLFNGNFLRPDRIVFLPQEKKTLIIDYKTGEKSKAHIKQVQEYIKAINTDKDSEVKGYLVYVDPLEIEEVVM